MSLALYYIHDPMCSWCWGFRPVWDDIQKQLPRQIAVHNIMGGLAPDSDQTMPLEMQQYIKDNWVRIQEAIPGTKFNYDFWVECTPRRSTYPACRAVLAAKTQSAEHEKAMIDAIQRAYYLEAKNPSDNDVLITLANVIGLNAEQFAKDLVSENIELLFEKDRNLYQQLSHATGVTGFPSLVLEVDDNLFAVPRNYTNSVATLDFIRQYTVA